MHLAGAISDRTLLLQLKFTFAKAATVQTLTVPPRPRASVTLCDTWDELPSCGSSCASGSAVGGADGVAKAVSGSG